MSYDRRNRTAHWVFEHLTRESVARNDNVDRAKSSFIEDQSIHPYFRSRNSDYKVIVYVCTFFINGNKYSLIVFLISSALKTVIKYMK